MCYIVWRHYKLRIAELVSQLVAELSEAALETALRAVGLDPSNAPDNGDVEAAHATRWAVVSGDVIRLILSDDCNPLASLVLAPAEIIAMTADLLVAARVRVGRHVVA
jgi:hypothetical protein